MANTQPILTERDERGHVKVPFPYKRPTVPCDACEAPASQVKNTQYGDFAACPAHESYLPGWIRDARTEARCEAQAAARFEDAAYGRAY